LPLSSKFLQSGDGFDDFARMPHFAQANQMVDNEAVLVRAQQFPLARTA